MLLKKTFGYSISIPYLRNTMQEQKYPMNNQGEIILYVKEHTITYHIKEIYNMGELEILPTTRKIRVVRKEGSRTVNRNIDFYNLDMIISVGYRVSSKRGVQFRQWANKVLKDYLLKGYAINQRLNTIEQRIENKFMQHEQRLNALDQKIAFFVRTSLPPVEGIFYNGQIFDAYKFATALTSLL